MLMVTRSKTIMIFGIYVLNKCHKKQTSITTRQAYSANFFHGNYFVIRKEKKIKFYTRDISCTSEIKQKSHIYAVIFSINDSNI